MGDSLFHDIRYAVRTLRRAPLFVATVAASMGLGLGLLGSAFTFLNRLPPEAHRPAGPAPVVRGELGYRTTRRQRFRRADYEALQREAQHFSQLAAAGRHGHGGTGRDARHARDRQLLRDVGGAAGRADNVKELRSAVAAWILQAFSVTASLLGLVGLAFAYSGTHAVVSFLVAQRRREFGRSDGARCQCRANRVGDADGDVSHRLDWPCRRIGDRLRPDTPARRVELDPAGLQCPSFPGRRRDRAGRGGGGSTGATARRRAYRSCASALDG